MGAGAGGMFSKVVAKNRELTTGASPEVIGPISCKQFNHIALQLDFDASLEATFIFETSNDPFAGRDDGAAADKAQWTDESADVTIVAATGGLATQMAHLDNLGSAFCRIKATISVTGDISVFANSKQ